MAKYLINEFYSDYSLRQDGYLDDNFLLIALENDNKEIITELLNNGADPNIKDETTGKTPLHP
jgi:ankyrin repeat protein